MAFRVDAVRIEVDGFVEFSGDANPYTPDALTVKFTLPPDHPLVRQLLDENHAQILAQIKSGPPGDVFG